MGRKVSGKVARWQCAENKELGFSSKELEDCEL